MRGVIGEMINNRLQKAALHSGMRGRKSWAACVGCMVRLRRDEDKCGAWYDSLGQPDV